MDIKIFTDNIEGQALAQCYEITSTPAFEHAKIRIMPDVHAGKGCVIGFTARDWTSIIPNVVGVDIGCSILVARIEPRDEKDGFDLEKLDGVINERVPAGFAVHEKAPAAASKIGLDRLVMPLEGKSRAHVECSLGTLGGGNHFIELDVDDDGNRYLVIHTGSRHLGKLVCEHYQHRAIQGNDAYATQSRELIARLQAEGRAMEIEGALKSLKAHLRPVTKTLASLSGTAMADYLNDVDVAQTYASANRREILRIVTEAMGWKVVDSFESVHNYVDLQDCTIRKGAISAHAGQRVIIPLNMRDGCILGTGKGNVDWNESAPHGAGRVLSRSAAKELVDMDEFKDAMEGIYSTSVCESTKDESPFAYKPSAEIIAAVADTVDIDRIIRPVYNFKAH